jgi:SSS family solute:Na+ symporter
MAQLITLSADPSDMAKNLWQAWWAWVVCFIVTIVISLCTKPKPDQELMGLVKGLTRTTESRVAAPTLKKPGFWAILALITVIVLNVIFW